MGERIGAAAYGLYNGRTLQEILDAMHNFGKVLGSAVAASNNETYIEHLLKARNVSEFRTLLAKAARAVFSQKENIKDYDLKLFAKSFADIVHFVENNPYFVEDVASLIAGFAYAYLASKD